MNPVVKLLPRTEINGYAYWFSTCYGVWMLYSPVSGFKSGFKSEANVLQFIKTEGGLDERKGICSETGDVTRTWAGRTG